MLTIRQQQMEYFGQAIQTAFETEMVVHCKEFSPRLCKVIGEEQLRQAIRQAIDRASGYGIVNRGPVRSYIEMALLFGSDFDTDPQYPWAREILTDDQYVFQMERAEHLYRKTLDYLDKVVGPEDSFTLRALNHISLLTKQPLHFFNGDLVADLLLKISSVYPEKYAYVGKEAMTLLIKEAITAASAYGMIETRDRALFAILMLAFGHGCTADPLYPWIENTLQDKRIVDDPSRARRLEKKASTWLEHVIAWHNEGARP